MDNRDSGLYGGVADRVGFRPEAVKVLTLREERIACLHGFLRPDLFSAFGLQARLSD